MSIVKILEVFQAGKAVANPEKWKRRQVNANQLLVVLTFGAALLKGTKYEIPDEVVAGVAGALFAVVNWLLTVASTDKVDVLGRPAQPDAPGVAGAPGVAPAPAPVADPDNGMHPAPARLDPQAEADLRGGP
jgi:hypothetical protein